MGMKSFVKFFSKTCLHTFALSWLCTRRRTVVTRPTWRTTWRICKACNSPRKFVLSRRRKTRKWRVCDVFKKIWHELQFKRRGNYSQASEAICASITLNSVPKQPWMAPENWPTSQWTQTTRLVSPIYFDFLTKTLNITFLLKLIRKSVFSRLLELTVYTKLTLPYELWTIQP